MFEFGRDLRKLFAQARESEDLSWLELIGVDLVSGEARRQSTDAGRVSCAHPHDAWLRASALWREHARRTGRRHSLERALSAAADAEKAARTPDQTARARLETAQTLLLDFDLRGGRDLLDRAAAALPAPAGCRSDTVSVISGVHARIQARTARFEDHSAAMNAAALLDSALHDLGRSGGGLADDIRMDRAALALETGVARQDARLLDQAGRDLLKLVEDAPADYRPLTRARALTLCGAGMAALGALAGDEAARQQGRAMFEAAADQFTPDHSPLDWAAIQIVRSQTAGSAPLPALRQAEALTAGEDLVVGALARDMVIENEVAFAASLSDLPRLGRAEAEVRARLEADRLHSEIDWAVDQIAMARIAWARARLTGSDASLANLALIEAADVARERGLDGLAVRAETLIAGQATAP